MKNYLKLFMLFIFFILVSCKESDKEKITRLVTEWQSKEIQMPDSFIFTQYAKDTVSLDYKNAEYKILVYTDSLGCTSCKLKLDRWKIFMAELDSLSGRSTPFLFIFHPKEVKDIYYTLRENRFDYPVVVDTKDELNKINKFPSDITFQTFLLNKANQVVVLGNPVHNEKVKALYLEQITGKKQEKTVQVQTTISTGETTVDMGEFPQSESRAATFTIKNTGDKALIIQNVDTSCGCTSADYQKKPVLSGEETKITVTIQPKEKGFFLETITVKCNIENEEIQFRIKGTAL